MNDREPGQNPENVAPAGRKPWTKPVLTVRSIEDVTRGTKSSVATDATGRNDRS